MHEECNTQENEPLIISRFDIFQQYFCFLAKTPNIFLVHERSLKLFIKMQNNRKIRLFKGDRPYVTLYMYLHFGRETSI